jgi:D-Tyr-tRNAtyr deacylase
MIGEEEIVKVGAESSCLTSNPSDANTCGMLVYVSFGEGCTQQSCQAAAKIIVNLPILTLGVWGDGGKTTNLFGMATKQSNASSLIIVPQANLICKVKNKGKNIQYHSQIDKTEGQAMYHYFVNYIRGLILEKQCEERNEPLPEWYQKSCSAQSGKTCSERASPSIPPQDLFRDPSLYQTFDENGIPLTDAQGELITKSAHKKLRKAQAAHKIRHLRYLREQPKSPTTSLQGPPYAWSPVPKEVVPITQHKEENWSNAIDPSFVHVVAGTYSKRQALEYSSDLGPFCHVIQV